MPDTPAGLDEAIAALIKAQDGWCDNWEGPTDDAANTEMARVGVLAAYPLIAAAVREAVAADIDALFQSIGDTGGVSPAFWDGMEAAADIARGNT